MDENCRIFTVLESVKYILTMTKNNLTSAEDKKILKASKEAATGKNVTKAMGIKEAVDYLKKLGLAAARPGV